MKGCHSCEHSGKKFETWDDSPCSKCEFSYNGDYFALVPLEAVINNAKYATKNEEKDPVYEEKLDLLKCCVFSLIRLSNEKPEVFKVLASKIENPNYTYSQIAQHHNITVSGVSRRIKKAKEFCDTFKEIIELNERKESVTT